MQEAVYEICKKNHSIFICNFFIYQFLWNFTCFCRKYICYKHYEDLWGFPFYHSVIVKPVKQKITDLKYDKRNINVKWNRDKKADGYYIYCANDKSFTKNLRKIRVAKNKNISKTITKLKPGKKYFVKVCSYKKSEGETILGDFSKTKNIKIKK